LQDWTLTDDFAGVDITELDNGGPDIDGRIWAIERFYQLSGTYSSFESVYVLRHMKFTHISKNFGFWLRVGLLE